jgi:hypothetical protein
MGLKLTGETPTVLHQSITATGDVPISYVTDNGVRVTDNGTDVFLFDAAGADTIAAPVVLSPISITAGGNTVKVLKELFDSGSTPTVNGQLLINDFNVVINDFSVVING